MVNLLKNESEVAENLIDYIKTIENGKQLTVKRIRCDGGGEYRSNELKRFCQQFSVIFQQEDSMER